jgi:hypothetical protein
VSFDLTDWLIFLVPSLPLAIAGLWLRRSARRAGELAQVARAARRRVGDVRPGVVALVGTWRALAGGRGLVEDGADAVVVDCGHGAPAFRDGAEVLVVGVARGDADHPRGAFRGSGRVPLVDASGAGDRVTTDVHALDGALAAARRRARVGGALFAVAVAIAGAGVVIVWRALNLPLD